MVEIANNNAKRAGKEFKVALEVVETSERNLSSAKDRCQQDIRIRRLAEEIYGRLAMGVPYDDALSQAIEALAEMSRALTDAKVSLPNATVAATHERQVRIERLDHRLHIHREGISSEEVGVEKRRKTGKIRQLIKDAKVSWRATKKSKKGVKEIKIGQMAQKVELNHRQIVPGRSSISGPFILTPTSFTTPIGPSHRYGVFQRTNPPRTYKQVVVMLSEI